MQETNIKAALVSTNSVTQGEQVAKTWKPLYDRFKIHIDFAYRAFRWDSESSLKAHVYCVIIGFSCTSSSKKKKLYYDVNMQLVDNINPYLNDAPNIFIESRIKPICVESPKMITGNRPADGGNLIIETDEYGCFLKKEPCAEEYIKRLVGGDDYINNKKRFCLWLVGITPKELRSMPEVLKRVESCKIDRLNGASDRLKLSEIPWLFREQINPENCLLIPCVSSEKRGYIPMGFISKDIISTDANRLLPGATLYHFGVLTSSVHMSWMRTVCGRLKSDYRYSKDIVYNNFPWCDPTEEQKAKIEKTAQEILDARALYSGSSLADLYDELTMPKELRQAHQHNDHAVIEAYGFKKDLSEPEIVAELMKKYQKITAKTGK